MENYTDLILVQLYSCRSHGVYPMDGVRSREYLTKYRGTKRSTYETTRFTLLSDLQLIGLDCSGER